MAIPTLTLALAALALLGTPAAAGAYSLVAVIETQSRGSLVCGDRPAPGETGGPLLGVSDEIALLGDPLSQDAPASPRPLVIIKELDRCSPPLFKALVTREPVSRVEIRLYDGHGVHFFTIRLEHALITRITRAVRQHGLHEEVAFTYRTMELVDPRSGSHASHDFGG